MTLRDTLRARPSKLPTAEARIPADPAAYTRIEQGVAILEAAAAAAVEDGPEPAATAQAQLKQGRAELAAQPALLFTFRCLPAKQWEELVDAHPPTDEQRRQGWQWDITTFRPAVLAACHIPDRDEDGLDVRGWVEIAEEGQLRPGELEHLFATAVQLNARQPPALHLGKG